VEEGPAGPAQDSRILTTFAALRAVAAEDSLFIGDPMKSFLGVGRQGSTYREPYCKGDGDKKEQMVH